MKFVRWFLGKLILFLDQAFPPKRVSRTPAEQAKAEAMSKQLSLYQFEACPFCVKVRRALQRMNLPVELRDAKKTPRFAEELVVGGGRLQVPCLRVLDEDRWIYESSDIIAYLESRLQKAIASPGG